MGIIIYNSSKKTAAGIHVLRAKAPNINNTNPVYYADTVIPYVMNYFKEKGTSPPFSVAIAGGAALLDTPQAEDTGFELCKAVKELLAKENLTIKIEQTGGSQIRSMLLNVDAGKIKVV